MLQGSVGFGFSILAAPLLILIDPRLVPGPLLISGLTLVTLIALRERQAIDLAGLKWALGGMVPGTFLGAMLLVNLPEQIMTLFFGGLILVAVIISLSGVKMVPTPTTLSGAGFLSGVMGATSAISGLPMALVYQYTVGSNLRSTLAAYFLGVTVFSLLSLGSVGYLQWQHLRWSLLLVVPCTIVGVWLSRYSIAWLDRGGIRPAVLSLSAVAALTAMANSLFLWR